MGGVAVTTIAFIRAPDALTRALTRTESDKERPRPTLPPAAIVSVSDAAREQHAKRTGDTPPEAGQRPGAPPEEALRPPGAGRSELSDDQKRQVAELQARDREVRAHEAAHKAAASGLGAGAPSFETQTGPDGREYAVGGEVSISVSEGRTPEETVAKAARIRAAAHAPAQPSSQDMSVAAQASQMEAKARMELAEGGASAEASEKGEAPDVGAAVGLAAPNDPAIGAKESAGRERGVSFRKGGVHGGHAHPDEGCGVCSSGMRAYQR
jgi:hypothetical protein